MGWTSIGDHREGDFPIVGNDLDPVEVETALLARVCDGDVQCEFVGEYVLGVALKLNSAREAATTVNLSSLPASRVGPKRISGSDDGDDGDDEDNDPEAGAGGEGTQNVIEEVPDSFRAEFTGQLGSIFLGRRFHQRMLTLLIT
ncbi:hypothetical protein TorRG33x02_211150 [Trema orientale]|uniref:Uncharacterized protein n=1 Tax=Trema orientale TaxID=63057 RepID=A0A2P5EC71_TREOI|nr:hypothetical protein TorRG33x02_211150 [Trema orientale]